MSSEDAATAANETLNRCDSFQFDLILISHISVGPALLCILVLSLLRKRKFLCTDKCFGRPGLQYPVNFIDERDMRWAYVAAFGILGDAIGNMFMGMFLWMPGIFVSGSPEYDEQFVEDFGWTKVFVIMVNVIEVSIIHYPIFACISARKHIIANLFGIAFALYWFITTVIILAFCQINIDADKNVKMGRILLLLITIPLLFCDLLVLWSNILSLYHNIREAFDRRNRRLSILLKVAKVAAMAKNLAEPEYVKQPECMQYLKQLFDKEKPSGPQSFFTSLKERIFYKKIQGFKYSPRVVCTMVTAAFILYKFMMVIVIICEQLLDEMDGFLEYIEVTGEVREIILSIFNADLYKIVDFIHLMARVLRIELYCSLFIALAIQIFNMIHMIFCYRKHLRNLYRGNRNWMFQELGSPAAIVVNSLRYSGYQIAYIGWGYLILTTVLFLAMFIITYILVIPLIYGYSTFLTRKLKTLGAVLVISIILYIIQLLLAKFFFLRERGRYLALTNRNVFHLLNFFMFTFNVIVGVFACLKRIVFSLVFGIIMLGRIDRSSIMRDWERFDVGYKAYLGMLMLDISHNHPVLRAFIHILQHQANKRRLARQILGEDLTKKPKLWPKNKWHLARTLMWNRQLAVDRILQLQKDELETYGKRNSNEETSIQPNGKVAIDISNDSSGITEGAEVPVENGYVNNGICFDDNIETVADAISDVGIRQRQQPHVTFHIQSEENTRVGGKEDENDRHGIEYTYL